jgi:hypothetical protein
LPVRWTIGRALVALAPEIDPELWHAVAAAEDVDPQLFIEGSYPLVDWSPTFDSLRPLGLDERRRRLRVALLDRVRPGGIWRLLWLPDKPRGKAVPFDNDQLAELVPDSFDIKRANFDDPEKSDVILGGRRYRVRVEVRDRRRERPTLDCVKGRVEQELAQGRISWEAFDRMTEEEMRARFHPESKKARNYVRAVREALRLERRNC